MLALALAVPALALEESDVEAAVSSSSREAVTGNVLVWFLCAVGFLKVSQKIDSFMASIGVNVGHTGGSMLGEAMVAFKGVSLAAGMAGKVVGNFADRASSRAGAAASGSSGFLQGGLAGVVSRKITNDAVLNDVGRQTLLRYARGEVLDAIGERQDVKRLEGTPAKTTMRFSAECPPGREAHRL